MFIRVSKGGAGASPAPLLVQNAKLQMKRGKVVHVYLFSFPFLLMSSFFINDSELEMATPNLDYY